MLPIYLASASERRHELLTLIKQPFQKVVVNVLEQRHAGEKARDYVLRLAREKAQAGVHVAEEDRPVLGADTIVVIDDQILEKPKDATDAARMLRQLSGRQHQVITGIAFADRQYCLSVAVVTEVIFRSLTDPDIDDYIASGEPMDKAGAYAIQGFGGSFVRAIQGSYHAVVGLPLVETQALLTEFIALQQGRK